MKISLERHNNNCSKEYHQVHMTIIIVDINEKMEDGRIKNCKETKKIE